MFVCMLVMYCVYVCVSCMDIIKNNMRTHQIGSMCNVFKLIIIR